MEWNEKKVLANIAQAATDDLLDRITAYRKGMEPEAVEMVEAELQRRGVTSADVETRRQTYERECLFHEDGSAMQCSRCRKPAVGKYLGWQKLWGYVPLFPREFRYCRAHQPIS
ncbi:MAG TPA: hypothetical protein VFE62_23520 [Gemmataceae bacterium]|nr:hypothetical protein [Gemmataceae bacterium]